MTSGGQIVQVALPEGAEEEAFGLEGGFRHDVPAFPPLASGGRRPSLVGAIPAEAA
jgi:hypothetical protein